MAAARHTLFQEKTGPGKMDGGKEIPYRFVRSKTTLEDEEMELMHEPRKVARAAARFAARVKNRETLDGKRRNVEAGSIGLEGPAYGYQDGEQKA